MIFMSNLNKYNQCFISSFSLDESAFENNIEYNSIPEWDSIGHMSLIAELEEIFGISMDIDDIIEFSSYNKGIEILNKYEVSI
jgi:acyl carrier protein